MASAFVCPFCQTPRVTALAIEGLHQNVTKFRCSSCDRTWAEAIGRRKPSPRSTPAAMSPGPRRDPRP